MKVSGESEVLPGRGDEVSDLAYLHGPPSANYLPLQAGKPIRPGDGVVALGYPLKGLLASEANVAVGVVSALAGLRNNPATLQITAPVLVGNSGGPLLDEAGNVVGVVVGKLDAIKIVQATGELPQNINFAVKVSRVRELLDTAGERYTPLSSSKTHSLADVAERARRSDFAGVLAID